MLRRPQAAAPASATPTLPEAPAFAAVPEIIPGLAEAQRAAEEARRAERIIAREIQSIRVEGLQAENTLERIDARFETGGTPQQADLDEKATAEAVIASIKPRISILEGSLRRAEQKTKDADGRAAELKRDELRRRAPLVREASQAALRRAEAEHEAWSAECNRLSNLYNRALAAANLDADLAATAECASTARGKVVA